MTDVDPNRLTCIERYHAAIVDLVADQSILAGDLAKASTLITETAADALDVERVSVWLLTDDGMSLECIDLFERTLSKHSKDVVLDAPVYPKYFAALATGRALDAHEARTDPRTSEFADAYLVPRGITSMLDAAIRVSGEVVGVICHEHVGAKREWTHDEVAFAAQIADQLAQALLNQERQQTERLLRIQRDIALAVSAAAGGVAEAMDCVLEHACRIEGIDCGGGYVVAENTGSVELVARKELPCWFVEQANHFDTDLPNSQIVMAGTPVYSHADDIYPLRDVSSKQNRLRAIAVLPIKHHDQVVAALFFASRTRDRIDTNARNALESVAAQIGSVIARARSDDALQDSESKYRNLVEQLLEGLVIAQGIPPQLVFVNQAMSEILGYSVDELQHMGSERLPELLHPEDREFFFQQYQARLLGDPPTARYELRAVRKDAELRWLAISSRHVQHNGQPASQALFMDITEQKIAEQQLRQREAEMAHMARVQTVGEMASQLAHELNQPLYAINNYAALVQLRLENGQSSLDVGEVSEAMERISAQVLRAADIVKRLREFVRGREPHRSTVDVHRLLRQTIDLLQPFARDKGVALELDVTNDLPPIQGDPIQVEQVVVNLVTNAIEAVSGLPAERQKVVISAQQQSEGGTVQITVKDSGKGIATGLEGKLFEAFVTTKEDGLGVGLTISRSIVHSHNGKIWAAHNEPHGAAFHFTLPCAQTQPALDR